MKPTMARAITWLLAHPETADLSAELQAEYDRVRPRATLAGWGILVGMVVVASVGGFFFTMRNDLDYLGEVLGYLTFAAAFMALPAAAVIIVAIIVMSSLRNTYVRYRMCAFLDARTGLSPEVAVARQMIETRPVDVVFRTVSVVGPVLLVVFGLAWAAVIWLATSSALNAAKNPKTM